MPLFDMDQDLPDPAQLDLSGRWEDVRPDGEGRARLVRVNRGLTPVAGHPAYDYQVRLSISYEHVGDDGLPALAEEVEAVDRLADDLRQALESGHRSLLAAVVTHGGTREMLFYTREPSKVAAWFEQQKRSPLTHRLEILIRPDPEWAAYTTYAGE